MLTKKVFIVLVTLGVGTILVLGHAVYSQEFTNRNVDTISKLNQACLRSKGDDGFGDVTLAGTTFHDQSGVLTVDCRVHLRQGSTLQLRNITIKSTNLLIDDLSDIKDSHKAKRPNHVIISHAHLSGANANFEVMLDSPSSTAIIEDSSIDYPQSVGVGVGAGDDDHAASITISRNFMRSTDADGKGVVLVSTGKASFSNNKFEVDQEVGTALLLGENCTFNGNINANDRCHGDQEVL